MADYSELTPEQLLALQRMQMLAGGAPNVSGGGFQSGPAAGQVNLFSTPQGQALMGGGAVSVPSEYGTLRVGGGGMYLDREGDRKYAFAPNATYEAGPVSLRYSENFGSEGRGRSAGGSLKIGDAQLGYDRQMSSNGGANSFSFAMPIDRAQLTAGVTRPDRGPMQYQGGVRVPGLLGGDFELSGQYTPDTNDKAVHARYRRRF